MKKFGFVLVLFALLAITPTASAQWTFEESKDPMTNEKQCYAASPFAPTSLTQGIYRNVKAMIIVRKDPGYEPMVMLYFDGGLTLKDTYSVNATDYRLETRVRWDYGGSEVIEMSFAQPKGERMLIPLDQGDFIDRVMNLESMTIELDYFSGGTAYFTFSLIGAGNAISRAVAYCN